ncbi:DUF167 domain-containing protein [Acidimicrobiaceae bacterium AH-315-P05]|nr:DUF167 domain-containing protein [Acidimicrobiaceae bacterium AH-315-P05]
MKPNTKRTNVGGTWDGPNGAALLVAVTAPASAGKANAAVIDALAKALAIKRRQITIVRGATNRSKLIEITEPSPDLSARLSLLFRQ